MAQWLERLRLGTLAAVGRERDRPSLALLELSRSDVAWATATGLAAAGLFATILTTHPGLGDAPETVAGVRSFGVLHAPGYPSYVIAARAFASLFPIGSYALRVNLFSLLCATGTIIGLQLLARRAGAARWASSLAALCVAAGAGFWFYAGLAKHDMFSGLVLVIVLHLALGIDSRGAAPSSRPRTASLAMLGAMFGIGLASSWPLMLLGAPTTLLILGRRRRYLGVRRLLICAATGLLVSTAMYGFVMVRAAQSPAVDWGGASTVPRLVRLIARSDFKPPPNASAGNGQPAGNPAVGTSGSPPGLLTRVRTNFTFFSSELGWLGLALAAWGAIVAVGRRRRTSSLPLAVTFAVGLVGTALVVGSGNAHGYDGDLTEEGFLLSCYVPLACWLAIGADDLAGVVRDSVAGRARAILTGARIAGTLAAAGIVMLSVTSHWAVAHRAVRPLADRYASTVFAELPKGAVLMVWGAEYTQPLIYRQVVFHQRPDVSVVAADGLSYAWYREQISGRLHHAMPPLIGNSVGDARAFARSFSGVRPVYLDMFAAQQLGRKSANGSALTGAIGYLPVGLLARVVAGDGVAAVSSPARLAGTVGAAERAAGILSADWRVWPNQGLAASVYATAGLEVARAYTEHRDLGGVIRWLENVLSIDPGSSAARADLARLALGRTSSGLRAIQ